jgi:hypothetical protein
MWRAACAYGHTKTHSPKNSDGYQIDDGAGDNSHRQTGVAAGTFAARSLHVGNPTRASL